MLTWMMPRSWVASRPIKDEIMQDLSITLRSGKLGSTADCTCSLKTTKLSVALELGLTGFLNADAGDGSIFWTGPALISQRTVVSFQG